MNRHKCFKVQFYVHYFRRKRSYLWVIQINCRQLFAHQLQSKREKRTNCCKFCISMLFDPILLFIRQLGADESLFARLDSPEATVTLTHQYRMNRTVMKLANDLTYHGQLICANDAVANATFKLKVCTKSKWIQRTLSPHIDQSAILLNTGNVCEMNMRVVDQILMPTSNSIGAALLSPTKMKSTRVYTNYCEVAIILALVKELKTMGLSSSMIGIIAPYALQVDLLKQSMVKHFDTEIEVNTVDQYQGRDKEVS